MAGRVLSLLLAAFLTMGAVAAPPTDTTALVAPDRTAAEHAVADLAAAVMGDADQARIAADARVLTSTEPAPRQTTRWWSGLPTAVQARLLRAAPQVVGNLEGVPYAVRDAANREVLAAGLADAQRQQAQGTGRGAGVLLAQRLTALEQVAAALRPTAGGPRRELVTLDVTGGRAAVAVGDLATARAVDFLVPGMYFTIADQIVDWTDTAAALQTQQRGWSERLKAQRSSAVVAWIGYRTPDVFGVMSFGAARDGALRLADAVNGLNSVRGADRPYVAVLAHSYGATAALLALQAKAFSADALAMIGAPGSPAQSVRQLAVPADEVYVGHAVWDGVATSGFFGSDPASPAYGAVPLGTAGGRDPLTGAQLSPAVGHMGYFAPTSEAMRNLALVGIGRGGDVASDASSGGVLALAR